MYFEDEVHFQRSTSIIRSWSLKGIVCEIKSPPVKEKTSFFGAMGADNGHSGAIVQDCRCSGKGFGCVSASVAIALVWFCKIYVNIGQK